ncbi:MAG: hypothetical protein GX638_00835 [Crenarchaeota archaeon]|nr:hypothetical protein [Thermoproteota archaeon]
MYNTACWIFKIQNPVIQNPIYTITANLSMGNMTINWVGTYENETITETSYESNNIPALTVQEQIRDEVMQYIKTNHNETEVYMQDLTWTGGVVDQGMLVGSSMYNYQSLGWNVTMQYPVTFNPVYTITINYYSPTSQVTPPQYIISWNGTWQSGTITETSYDFTP